MQGITIKPYPFNLPKIFASKLLEAIVKKRKDSELFDFHFKFVDKNHENGRLIGVHSLILAAQSNVFNAMLNGLLKEDSEVEISDVSFEIFEILIKRMYGIEVEPETIEDAIDLFSAAHKYDCKEPAEYARLTILEMLDEKNVDAVFEYATLYSDDIIKQRCLWTKFSSIKFADYKDYKLPEKHLELLKFENMDSNTKIKEQLWLLEFIIDDCQRLTNWIRPRHENITFYLKCETDCEDTQTKKTQELSSQKEFILKIKSILCKKEYAQRDVTFRDLIKSLGDKYKIFTLSQGLDELKMPALEAFDIFAALAQKIVKEILKNSDFYVDYDVESTTGSNERDSSTDDDRSNDYFDDEDEQFSDPDDRKYCYSILSHQYRKLRHKYSKLKQEHNKCLEEMDPFY